MSEKHAAAKPTQRREFLGLGGAIAAVGAFGLTACASRPAKGGADHDPVVGPTDVVLFQGDSITDADRVRESEANANQHAALGDGYAWLAAASLLTRGEASSVRCFNRGISGNKVFQLAKRWEQDCLALVPDVLSILIGVNDIWHQRNGKYDGTCEIYERDYDALLARTRAALPRVKLVVCEPFVLRCGAVDDTWFPDFDQYRAAARRVALAHNATWVPFHERFERACEHASPEHWAKDGVHPTPAGAALMAQTWLEHCA